MKKITYESWVASFIERLSDYFNLAGWEILIEYSDKPSEHEDGNVYAQISMETDYQMATMTLFPAAKEDWVSGNTRRLVARLVHELTHIFLDPFKDAMLPFLSPSSTPAFMSITEQQTQKLTMVFLKSLPKDLIPPR